MTAPRRPVGARQSSAGRKTAGRQGVAYPDALKTAMSKDAHAQWHADFRSSVGRRLKSAREFAGMQQFAAICRRAPAPNVARIGMDLDPRKSAAAAEAIKRLQATRSKLLIDRFQRGTA